MAVVRKVVPRPRLVGVEQLAAKPRVRANKRCLHQFICSIAILDERRVKFCRRAEKSSLVHARVLSIPLVVVLLGFVLHLLAFDRLPSCARGRAWLNDRAPLETVEALGERVDRGSE